MKFGLVFLFLFSFAVFAQTDNADLFRSSKRAFDQSKLETYKANPDFSYVTQSVVDHWWNGVYEWVVNKLSDWLSNSNPEKVGNILYIIFKILIWSLALFAIGMLAYSLYKKGAFGIIHRKKTSIDHNFIELEDKVLETNWQELIDNATNNKEFNIAIRLLYLQLLQSMNEIKLIEWDKSKTIRDYHLELTREYKEDYSVLAKYYQYAWFSDILIEESQFQHMQTKFQSFTSNLHVA